MTVSDRFSVSNYSHYQQFGHFQSGGLRVDMVLIMPILTRLCPFISTSIPESDFHQDSDQPPIIESFNNIPPISDKLRSILDEGGLLGLDSLING